MGLIGAQAAYGQMRPSPIPAEDQVIVDRQAGEIFGALEGQDYAAAKSVFPIYLQRGLLAYGMAIGDERLLTKASEMVTNGRMYTVSGQDALEVEIVGTYAEHDLAVLSVPGLKAPVAEWANAEEMVEGTFLGAIRPDGRFQSLGVLSVQERSLKTADQGFLGVQMNTRAIGEGVQIKEVVPDSAAQRAGMLPGDRIVTIKGKEMTGFFEMSNELRRLRKGEAPEIGVIRNGQRMILTPVLGGRPPEGQQSQRLDYMDRASGTRSRVRHDFSNVMQTDMELQAHHSGLPVVDLNGDLMGMVIARQGRISTLVLPGDEIEKIIAEEPEVYEPRVLWRQGARSRQPRDYGELDEMQQLMNQLRRRLRGR